VLQRGTRNDPSSVVQAIEHYGNQVLRGTGRWLKVAGDEKAEILTTSVGAGEIGGGILEIGAYCGYSSTRMAIAVPDVPICSLEVDPVHVIIARNVLMYGGINHRAYVWTGHSKDLIPRIEGRYGGPGELHFSAVFMDQKGSLYERDMDAMQYQGILTPGAVIVADNVLKPGAPLFLRRIVLGENFDAQILNVTEFAMPAEDWMSLSVLTGKPNIKDPGRFDGSRGPLRAREGPLPGDVPPDEPHPELLQLHWEADRMRERATGPGRSVTFEEWADFAAKMKKGMDAYAIRVTAVAPKPGPRRVVPLPRSRSR